MSLDTPTKIQGNRARLTSLVQKGTFISFRRTQEGCGGLGGENPAAFPQAQPIFQQPFSLPESAQNLGRDSISHCRKIGE